MSIDALMAMTSDKRWPSTIRGIADRFTNDGGRMRHRTGFDELAGVFESYTRPETGVIKAVVEVG